MPKKLPPRPSNEELKAALRVFALDVIYEELEAQMEEEEGTTKLEALRDLNEDEEWVDEISACQTELIAENIREIINEVL